jgi:pectate lyase
MKTAVWFVAAWLGLSALAAAQVTEGFESGLPTTAPTSPTNVTLGSGVWTIMKGVRSTTKRSGTYALNLNNGSTTASYADSAAVTGVSTVSFWVRGSGASTFRVDKSVNGGAFVSVATQAITSSFASYTVAVNEAGNVRIRFRNTTSQTHYLDDVTINGTGQATPTPTQRPTATPTNRPTATPTGGTPTPTNRPTARPTTRVTATPTNRPTATPTATPTGPTPTPPPSGQADGFASLNGGTTGGAGAPVYTVTSAAQFLAVSDQNPAAIIQVSGTINWSGMNHVRSNKTVIGLPGSRLVGGGLYLYGAQNVIIKNLVIEEASEDAMGITTGSKNIWVDHVTFAGSADGMLDIVRESDFVTVSWCKFFYNADSGHNFSNLVSHSDSAGSDVNFLRITYHHNWWGDMVRERMPSVRFGRVHVYNNYFNAPGNNYCIRTRINAQVLAENNYFENVKNPWERYITSGTPGKLRASGNILVNTSFVATGCGSDGCVEIPDGNDTVFAPGYGYNLENGANVKSSVVAGAGAR